MEVADKRIVYIDTERAGRSIKSPIIELSAVAVTSGLYRELSRIEMKIEFNVKETNVKFLGLSKFRPSVWEKYAIPEKEAVKKLAHFLRANATDERNSKDGTPYKLATLCGHNVEHDASTLRRWFSEHGEFFPATRSPLDTIQLTRWFFETNPALVPPPDFKLTTLAEYFSLRTTPSHEALSDALCCVELTRLIAQYTRVGIHNAAY
ncbi:3'-5' exonuclease [Botrimarina mediterranea]|uniref:Exonuclease domain-containing protein n=1 Tax=Botrimarina mediterranea TaxID=2528022 RepID=A0A518K5Y8_9BACT|nr:exonuclease domain-containing protein [Botrimarina mediterranea]QDV73195.1 hypothetical protein Spa11_13910 [Botrimarina mediterranea]